MKKYNLIIRDPVVGINLTTMKQRFHNINNIGFTNYHRIIFIYKLCTIYRDSFRLSNPYYTRH
ncbi:hypothetical protein GcM3_162016 [Golovinomyces cichoracearum]|uniref:Uncharacterized protein n=1 Tax=Golovinomyces cichoracearum TaxID=62708 RepID=A0A420HTI7_9PEZI|nr:hypothetical protein GcM3_162016 [Golovinomyces cichoracearum]